MLSLPSSRSSWAVHFHLLSFTLIYFTLLACNGSELDLCPTNCTCDTSNVQSTSLTIIGCRDRTGNHRVALVDEINDMIVKFDKLTDLTIIKADITDVPSEVCTRTVLRTLRMDNNKLQRLPDNCFSKLLHLEELTMDSNQVMYLQDGLFDGLMNLTHISLKNNTIRDIGLRLFANSSDLPNLRLIELSKNLLTTLEPWPFIRAAAANVVTNVEVKIDVSYNSITKFTNAIGWRYTGCYSDVLSPSVYRGMFVDLTFNKIEHYSTLLEALKFDSWINYQCWVSRHNMLLHGNEFVCDCTDFQIFAYSYLLQHTNLLEGVYCSNLNSVQFTKASVIPLDKLVCDVEFNCPSDCTCRNQPYNSTIHVLCSSSKLTTIPNVVPPFHFPRSFFMSRGKESYKLDLSGNNISELTSRQFLRNVIHLDISHSHLKNITEDAWRDMEYAERIYLNDNLLTTIPFVSNLSNFSFITLSLYNNPLSCECDQLFLKSMLLTVYERLEHPNSMKCNSPKRLEGRTIFDVDDEAFCNDPSPNEMNSIPTIITTVLAFTVATIIIVGVIISPTIRYKCFKKFGIHPFDLDECDGEDMEYDVFISFAHEDSALAREILTYLESNSYKVCFHQRDFIPGNLIINNILDAISKSKRVLCLISYNFLASSWCMEEFHAAFTYNVELKRRRLIALISSQFKFPESEMSLKKFMSLKNFTSSHTYIDYVSSDWKQRLLYALPVSRLGNIEIQGEDLVTTDLVDYSSISIGISHSHELDHSTTDFLDNFHHVYIDNEEELLLNS